MSAFHLSIAVTPLVMRTGKGREAGTGYSKPFVQPKRRPRDVSWSHPPSGTWGEHETPQAHWNWDEHQMQETMLKHDIRMSSPKQTVQSKQLPEPGVASALSDEGDSGNEDDGTQTNSDATVRIFVCDLRRGRRGSDQRWRVCGSKKQRRSRSKPI